MRLRLVIRAQQVSVTGVVGIDDPFQREALAEADLAAGIVHLDAMSHDMLEHTRRGNVIDEKMRLEFRRHQTRAVQRVVASVDYLMLRSGSAAVLTNRPIERPWRDLRTAAAHVCNVKDVIYTAWTNRDFGSGAPVNALH